MADLKAAEMAPEEQFWSELDNINAGMLGIEGSHQHMQPMAPIADRQNGTIWFVSKKSSDLVRSVNGGSTAHFCLVGSGHDYHACVSGQLQETMNRQVLEKAWNPVVAAWFDDGKDDPELTMLALKLADGAIWASTGNPLTFGWEIAKSNLSEGEPNIGVQNRLSFGN